ACFLRRPLSWRSAGFRKRALFAGTFSRMASSLMRGCSAYSNRRHNMPWKVVERKIGRAGAGVCRWMLLSNASLRPSTNQPSMTTSAPGWGRGVGRLLDILVRLGYGVSVHGSGETSVQKETEAEVVRQ